MGLMVMLVGAVFASFAPRALRHARETSRVSRENSEDPRMVRAGGALPMGGDGGVAPGRREARFGGDAGVARASRAIVRERSASVRRDVTGRPELVHEEILEEEGQTAGWRLGRTRRRLALVTARAEELNRRAAYMEAEGHPMAARQRQVADRFANRLDELRAEETTLLEEAEREGSLGDVEAGLGAPVRERVGVQGALP